MPYKTRKDPTQQRYDALAGRRIADARHRLGLSQFELAKKTGWSPDLPDNEQPGTLSKSQINNYEQGVRSIDVSQAIILSKVLQLSEAYLMGIIDETEEAMLTMVRDRLRPAIANNIKKKRRA